MIFDGEIMDEETQTIRTVSSDSEVTQLRLLVAKMEGMLTTALANLTSSMNTVQASMNNIQTKQESLGTEQATMKQQIINLEHDVKDIKESYRSSESRDRSRTENSGLKTVSIVVMPLLAAAAIVVSIVALIQHR